MAIDLMKPVRKIPKNYRNVTGIAAHVKASGEAMYESSLERDFLTMLEFSPDVESYVVQPVKLEWIDTQDTPRSYTPDTFVLFSKITSEIKKPMLCEVKYRKDLWADWNKLRPKYKAAIRFAKAQDWQFKIITEIEIRTFYLENARFLLRYRSPVPDAGIMQLLYDKLEDIREATPTGLIKAVYQDEWNQAKALWVLWYMVSTFQIGTDLRVPLNMDSPIWCMQ
jgi:hypothetical protein